MGRHTYTAPGEYLGSDAAAAHFRYHIRCSTSTGDDGKIRCQVVAIRLGIMMWNYLNDTFTEIEFVDPTDSVKS